MKGLDLEEQETMALIASGYLVVQHGRQPTGAPARLLKRGLVVEQTVSCGAYDCVGHQALTMTSVGVMVWNAVRCGG